ncbi:hypothetical protein DFH11DRAFT_1728366 [Phellopilus nigrolimitatus]|nr:hypothetical protein DFH11DRAFT_1728366 [Phellopilus nigrolimitatus]
MCASEKARQATKRRLRPRRRRHAELKPRKDLQKHRAMSVQHLEPIPGGLAAIHSSQQPEADDASMSPTQSVVGSIDGNAWRL